MEPIEPRKLFVGGVSSDTNEDTLKEYFSQYGTVEDPMIIRHRHTGVGRGFGFVTFSAVSMAEDALQHKNHVILGKQVEVKRAIPKPHRQENSDGFSSNDGDGVTEIKNKKIFVGGLPLDLIEEEFRSFFESFGTVIDAPLMLDKGSGRPRGFGFITFDSEDAVNNVLQNKFHKLKNKWVEVKRAHPKKSNDKYGFLYGYNNLYSCFPAYQIYQCYTDWSYYGFGNWASPSYLFANPTIHSNYTFYPSCGVCTNGCCNGSCHQVADPITSGNSNGNFGSSEGKVSGDRKSSQSHGSSSLKINGVEHQNGRMESNATEHQIVKIVQKPMPESTKREQNGKSSHDS